MNRFVTEIIIQSREIKANIKIQFKIIPKRRKYKVNKHIVRVHRGFTALVPDSLWESRTDLAPAGNWQPLRQAGG